MTEEGCLLAAEVTVGTFVLFIRLSRDGPISTEVSETGPVAVIERHLGGGGEGGSVLIK